MSQITVIRQTCDAVSTQSTVLLDSQPFGYGLEPRMDQSQGKPYAVPEGTYRVMLAFSERFGELTPHVLGVPGFDAVEIHPGNKPADTHGCLLIGLTEAPDWVGTSRVAFEKLMGLLQDPISITYTYSLPGTR
jgi:hypothetical protein